MSELENHIATLFDAPDDESVPEDDGKSVVVPDETGGSVVIEAEAEAEEAEAVEVEAAEAPAIDYARVAQARLREISALRTKNSEMRDRQTALEVRLAALERRGAPDDEIPPEMLEADPALRFVTKKLDSIEGQLSKREAAEAEALRFENETREVVQYTQDSRRDFLAHTPDWDDAYRFVRQAYADAGGRKGDPNIEQWLNVQEHQAARDWMENGEDPALKIYELAVAAGYRLGQAPVVPAAVPQNGKPKGDLAARVRRVKDAVAAPAVTSVGSRDMGNDVVSREEFYNRYPQGERLRIFNSSRGADIFEMLAREGKVPTSMLEGSPR